MAPDEISFLRVQSMDARSYGRGSLTSSFLSSACPDLDLVAAAAAHGSSVAAAILAAVEGGILPPGKNALFFGDLQIARRFGVCGGLFRRAGARLYGRRDARHYAAKYIRRGAQWCSSTAATKPTHFTVAPAQGPDAQPRQKRSKAPPDRKSTRLNSSHGYISYAVFCLKKKKTSPTPYETTTRSSLSSATSRRRD